MRSLNSFNTRKQIIINDKLYHFFDLNILASSYGFDLSKIPNSIKILLENLIRNEDGESVTKDMISNLCQKINETKDNYEIIPQLFFVPCLGFDLEGFRIGYGGGFYDKTFAKLKKLNLAFYTVGFAYDDQKQNKLPVEKFDYKLDFVLTEKQLYTFL